MLRGGPGASVGDYSGCSSSFLEDISTAEGLTCKMSEESQRFLTTESDTDSTE